MGLSNDIDDKVNLLKHLLSVKSKSVVVTFNLIKLKVETFIFVLYWIITICVQSCIKKSMKYAIYDKKVWFIMTPNYSCSYERKHRSPRKLCTFHKASSDS